MFKRTSTGPEVLLAHPGGPFYARKDDGCWSIPKGELEEGEDGLGTAIREFEEETGIQPSGELIPLGEVRQKAGKIVLAWAFERSGDVTNPPPSNTFELEWPPRSGRIQHFPEIDRVEFFDLETAARKMNPAQIEFLSRLLAVL